MATAAFCFAADAMPGEPRAVGKEIWFMPNGIVFADAGEARNELDKISAELANTEGAILVYGYVADSDVDYGINPSLLARDRAAIIRYELLQRGIEKDRFEVPEAYDIVGTWAANRSEETRAPNRRAAVFLIPEPALIEAVVVPPPPPPPPPPPEETQARQAFPWWILLVILLIVFFGFQIMKGKTAKVPSPKPVPVVPPIVPVPVAPVAGEVYPVLVGWWVLALEPFYPVLFFDSLWINVQEGSGVIRKAVYLVLAIRKNGQKEVLGMWVEQNKEVKYWMSVMNELKNRGLKDALIAVVDGLTGFPEAITAVFPKTEVQQCIIHLVRNSVKFLPENRQAVTDDLKKIYLAPNEKAAASALEDFSKTWDAKYPMISKSWRNRWAEVIPFLKFKPEIRKAIYSTNAIGSINVAIQRVVKNRQPFTNEEEAIQFLCTAMPEIAKHWTNPIRDWRAAVNQFAGVYGDRVPPL
jgi:hypothetical protein